MAKIENDETLEFDHADFLKVGWISSEMPADKFGWDRLQNGLPLVEKVQSKMREKFYRERKWN